jgi:hypothetical protein
MKCINHNNADAIDICCVCGRGLCQSCILDSQAIDMFCSERCRATHSKRDGFRRSVIVDYRANQKSYKWLSFVMGTLSVFFLGFALMPFRRGDTFFAIMLLVLACVLLAATRVLRSISLRYKGMADQLE